MTTAQIDIEKEISKIKKLALGLKTEDLVQLEEDLRQLRNIAHDLEYFTDEQVRIIKENAAERKVRGMIQAGYRFNSIVIDKVHFYHDENGELRKGFDPRETPF